MNFFFKAFCTVHSFNIWNKNQLMSLFQFYLYIVGSLHVSGPPAHPQESSHSCSHKHWFGVCTALTVCSVCCTQHIIYCRISTCFGPTGPSSGEFTQLFTQPLVQCLYCSGRVLCIQDTRPEQYRH